MICSTAGSYYDAAKEFHWKLLRLHYLPSMIEIPMWSRADRLSLLFPIKHDKSKNTARETWISWPYELQGVLRRTFLDNVFQIPPGINYAVPREATTLNSNLKVILTQRSNQE